jgi:hypothetical protein
MARSGRRFRVTSVRGIFEVGGVVYAAQGLEVPGRGPGPGPLVPLPGQDGNHPDPDQDECDGEVHRRPGASS